MTSMTGLPRGGQLSAESAAPTLAALREVRARRAAALRRRAAPIGMAVVAVVAISIARSHPRPGLHGTPLVITVVACCYLVSLLALIRLMGTVLSRLPSRPVKPRVLPLLMTVLVASSVTLEWLQSSGAGTVGLYAVVAVTARTYPRRVSATMFGACLAYFLTLTLNGEVAWFGNQNGLPGLTDVVGIIAVYLVSLFIGRIRVHEAQEEQLLTELEESRAAEVRAAALAERQRLAREMHDVLAHSLSGLVVQLEGARLLAASDPGDARLPEAVDRAHRLAKSGLDEARQVIGMLRDDELPGPDRLSELAGEFTADTGIPCRFTQAGERRALSPAVRLALYRVAQEALTNVRRHARPDEVDLRLDYLPGAVTLTVEDTGRQPVPVSVPPGGAAASGGYGLTGMRERAGLLGGVLSAGPTQAGFLVRLRVPA
jgi:signal transduction histidine kinase